jgi:copper chaperone
MKTIIFETTLKCQGCVDKITPDMNQISDIKWEVDLQSLPRKLKVEGTLPDEKYILDTLQKNGFKGKKIEFIE